MSAGALLQYGLMIGTLLLLLVGMVIGIGLTAHAGQNVRKSLFPWVFVAIGLGMIWSPLSSRRNLSLGTLEFMATAGEVGSALWLSRMLTLVVVFISASRIIGWVYTEGRRTHPGLALYLALMLVLVTHNIIAGAFGTKPAFIHNGLYPLLLFTAAYLSVSFEYERIIRFAKVSLFFFLLFGALAAVIQPGIAVQNGYSGLLPGIRFRYWGLGAHANSLGPLAVLFLLIAWHQPFARRIVQWFAVGVGLVSLLLTQSKTAWGGAILAFGTMALARFWPLIKEAWNTRRSSLVVVVVLLSTVLTGIAIAILLALPETTRTWHAFVATRTGADFLTLTGRVDIWAMALEDWAHNPMFGYGPTWGDLEYRLSVGTMAAYHAHNQFIHSLAAAGLVGLVASVLYVLLLVRYAIRGFIASNGLTAGLLAMTLVRTVTEVPLAIKNWEGAEVFTQLVTFSVILAYGARKPVVAPTLVSPDHGRPLALLHPLR